MRSMLFPGLLKCSVEICQVDITMSRLLTIAESLCRHLISYIAHRPVNNLKKFCKLRGLIYFSTLIKMPVNICAI